VILLIVAIDAYEAWADWRAAIAQVGTTTQTVSEAFGRWKTQEIESAVRTLSLAALAAAFLGGLLYAMRRRDASEQERAELNEKVQEMQSREALGFFAASVAHDFNNILQVIEGCGVLARDSIQTSSVARLHLDKLLTASERARKLVRRVLTFDAQRSLSYGPVQVATVVAEALEQMRLTLPTGVRLNVKELLPDAQVMGDPIELHQILANLCMNAAHALPRGGEIELAVESLHITEAQALTVGSLSPGDWLRLSVTDSGVGLDAQQIETIFQPFYTTRRRGAGTGIGLTVVRNIVTSMGGAVHVDSRPGGPTCFSVYLPEAHAPVPLPDDLRTLRGSGETVLVVDNEPALVGVAEEMLATLGYEPVGFDDPVRALAALRADPSRFDAMLSDERMPELSGTMLATTARALHPGLPVVIMTAYRDSGLPARADSAGVAAVLEKPLQSRELANTMHQLLGHNGRIVGHFN
jgi:signal transduction histidine kinase/ActR/RegA family two-component response regulator